MDGDTKGKGPFAKQIRARMARWNAPPIKPTRSSIESLLSFVERKNDVATLRVLKSLATLSPEYRLARNLSSLVRCMASRRVVDALQDGLSDNEVGVLSNLEYWGASPDLLGVVHALLDVRARQSMVVSLGDEFAIAKSRRRWTLGME